MIDVGDTFCDCIVRHVFADRDAADSAGVNLDILQTGVVDHVLGHVEVVAAFSARHSDRATSNDNAWYSDNARNEGFFQPCGVDFFQHLQPVCRCGIQIRVPDGSRIDQQNPIGAESFAGCGELDPQSASTVDSPNGPQPNLAARKP